MDILQKCRPWTAEHLLVTGRDCYFRAVGDTFDGTEADFQGRRVIVAASHDYLGLSAEPRVRRPPSPRYGASAPHWAAPGR